MSYKIQVTQVSEGPLVVARDIATSDNLSAKIIPLFDSVYGFLQGAAVKQPGHNVVLYWDRGEERLLYTEGGVRIEAGVQISTSFEGTESICYSATPAGAVATTVHSGPYSGIPAAHGAVRNWCKENDRILAGPNWEIYGDWSDDPQALTTEILYLLQ